MKMNPDADFEYKASFATIPEDFPKHDILVEQLKDLNPVPPKGRKWKLHSAVSQGGIVFFFWERKRLDFSKSSPFGSDGDDDNRGNR